jgi:Putative phage tail protein
MTIHEIKSRQITETPVLLFDCELSNGSTERWSTHEIMLGDRQYEGRVVKHNVFDIRSAAEDGIDALSKVSVTLANADSYFSQIERSIKWKGARLNVRFVFIDVTTGEAASDEAVIFRGSCNPPDEITESTVRLTFLSRMSLQRVLLPEVRIQRRCPWMFPGTATQRQSALDGGDRGRYSPFYRCGYSAGLEGGVGTTNGGTPFTECDYTKSACVERGMFDVDVASITTRRFGGIEFVPSTIGVKSYGEQGTHTSGAVENEGRYNDFVPLVYGTAWYRPPIVFARNDGNLTHMEVLLGMGHIEVVEKVLVNDIELPSGDSAEKPTATGWFNMASYGARNGSFNLDFTDGVGKPTGDPYGSMAVLSVVVPNRISDGRSLPKVEVLIRGMKLPVYDESGSFAGDIFTNNPAWVLLDLLGRSGWAMSEVDLSSFAKTAAYCAETIETTDLHGNPRSIPRFQCNLVIRKRRSAADVIRGVRNGAALYLTYGDGGLLQLGAESSIAIQQGTKPECSNSTETLNGGWPAYEFGDAGSGFSDIARRSNGDAAIRLFSRSTAETPNRYTVEFQDEFNGFQQDSLSLVDVADAVVAGQEISASMTALGLPNFSQAGRVLRLQLDKAIRANTYIEFETGVRGIGLKPGDLITISYAKEGFQRQLFRIVKMAPGLNYRSITITAQIHSEEWYVGGDGSLGVIGGGRQPRIDAGLPKPLVGAVLDDEGVSQFAVEETPIETADGSYEVSLSVSFATPAKPSKNAPGIPLMSLAPQVSQSGGSLKGDRSLYYAVSAVSAEGEESALSFVARATLAPGFDSHQVTLHDLSFAPRTASFRVYRGVNPTQLLRVADAEAVAEQWVDSGADEELAAPPDPNYHHANFYWRLELLPETSGDVHSETTVGNESLAMLPNEYRGKLVRIAKGKGRGQERMILSNIPTELTLATKWNVEPDATSMFVVVEPTWNFAALTETSPVVFRVPNRENAVIHISGRSADVHDRECSYELSPLTRWTIGGAAGDNDVPPAPIFGLNSAGRGMCEISGIGFTDLENTRTITAGSLTLHYWNELAGATSITLSQAASDSDTVLNVSEEGAFGIGSLVQIGAELVSVDALSEDHLQLTVQRGALGSSPTDHDAGAKVWCLQRKAFVLPFVRGVFGTPASGSYSQMLMVPDIRIAAAELYVTNVKGNGQVGVAAFSGLVDGGIRTLSGGQFSMQIDGPLAVQSDAVPQLSVESPHAIRDIFATVIEPSTGAPITVRVTRDGETFCTLTIPPEATLSDEVIDGLALPPLGGGWKLGLDVISTGTDRPGAGLTVTIRL